MNQTGNGVYHGYLECKTKRIFGIPCPGKKVSFSYGKLRISRIANFENNSFLSGQEVVQIKPNSVWSITFVPRV